MAAPNIVNVSTITAKTAVAALTTTNASLLTNSASSNQVYKINSIVFANYTSSAVSGTCTLSRSSTSYYFVGAVSVPANSTLIVLAKDTSIYLEEGDIIQGLAGANSSLTAIISYEIIQ